MDIRHRGAGVYCPEKFSVDPQSPGKWLSIDGDKRRQRISSSEVDALLEIFSFFLEHLNTQRVGKIVLANHWMGSTYLNQDGYDVAYENASGKGSHGAFRKLKKQCNDLGSPTLLIPVLASSHWVLVIVKLNKDRPSYVYLINSLQDSGSHRASYKYTTTSPMHPCNIMKCRIMLLLPNWIERLGYTAAGSTESTQILKGCHQSNVPYEVLLV